MKLGKSQCGTVKGAGAEGETADTVPTQRINKMFLLAKQKAPKMTQEKKRNKEKNSNERRQNKISKWPSWKNA